MFFSFPILLIVLWPLRFILWLLRTEFDCTLTSLLAGWPRLCSGSAAAWPLFSGAGCQGSTPGSPAVESCTAALWSPDPDSTSSCRPEPLPQTFAGPEYSKGDMQFKRCQIAYVVEVRFWKNANEDFLTWISWLWDFIEFGTSGIGPSSLSFFSKPETRPSTFLIWLSRLRDAFALKKSTQTDK